MLLASFVKPVEDNMLLLKGMKRGTVDDEVPEKREVICYTCGKPITDNNKIVITSEKVYHKTKECFMRPELRW